MIMDNSKPQSRLNTLKHGLLRKKIKLMPDESRYLFNKFNRSLVGFWQPNNLSEGMLVEQLGFNYWRLKRAFKLETEFLQEATGMAEKTMENYKKMGFIQKEYSIKYLRVEDFDKFARYITSIQRQILRILHELERLQATRKGQNVPLPAVVDIDIEGNGD